MSKQEVREQQIHEWLQHLRCCEAAGGSLASYARQHGIAEWKLYQWRSRLVRDGRWPATMRVAAPKSPSEVVPTASNRRRSPASRRAYETAPPATVPP